MGEIMAAMVAPAAVAGGGAIGSCCCALAVALAIPAVCWYFEYQALKPFALSPIFAMHTHVDADKLPGQCLEEWHLLHFTLVAQVFMLFIGLVLQIMMFLGVFCFFGCRPDAFVVGMSGTYAVQALTCVISSVMAIALYYVAIKGFIIVVFRYNEEDIVHCEQVHNTAWWIFVFLLGIISACCCCYCCLLCGTKTDAREGQQDD